ncbi:MAG TPA: carbon starvation CstA 5TM domain-containing protein, partial [Polyangiaceae bacterium]
FEALFVLTTIDTGTRVGRFLLQEFVGKVWTRFGETSWAPGAAIASAAIVGGWSYFILTGSISTIWPMFGIANQLLAATALAVGTTVLMREAPKPTYALLTMAPLVFVGTTTITAGVQAIQTMYLPMLNSPDPKAHSVGLIDATLTAVLLLGVIAILIGSAARWVALWRARRTMAEPAPA